MLGFRGAGVSTIDMVIPPVLGYPRAALEHALTANRDDVVWLKRGPKIRARSGA